MNNSTNKASNMNESMPKETGPSSSHTVSFILPTGREIPAPGFGTWLIDDEEARTIIKDALKTGFRHIDTAEYYGNEAGIGQAIRETMQETGLNRDAIFLTSKAWISHRGREAVKKACEDSLKRFGLDHVDLYLLHWPANEKEFPDTWDSINQDSWKGMMDLYKEGKAKAIGVSNFLPHQLASLLEMEIPPMVNQIEFHPGWFEPANTAYCAIHHVIPEGYMPLGRGEVLTNPVIEQIDKTHQKTPAQICLRYALQHGVIPLPKSTHTKRMQENLDLFDFELSDKEMQDIDGIGIIGYSGHDPATVILDNPGKPKNK